METTDIYLWIINKSDYFKEIVYSILVGVIGSLLLCIFFTFFTGLASLDEIEKILPFIVGFNAALTGYNLIYKTNNSLKYRRTCAVGSGIIMVIITVVLLNVISFKLAGGYIIYITDVILLIVVGTVLSGLGAILAIKYINLN